MTEDHDELRHLLGPWVLGGLDANDRARFGAHLAACDGCRAEVEAATPVAGLLRRVPQDVWAEPARATTPEQEVAPLLGAVAARRRAARRRAVALGALAAAVALLAGVVLGRAWPTPGRRPPPPRPCPRVHRALGPERTGRPRVPPMGHPGGARARRPPPTGRYTLVVHATDGRRETGATWSATDRDVVRVVGATSLPAGRIATLEVVSAAGDTLAEGHTT